MIIYLIRNTLNGRWYVGKTIYNAQLRWEQHKRSAKQGAKSALYNAIRARGHEIFEVVHLISCDTIQELNAAEIVAIAVLKAIETAPTYNMTEGGDGGDTGCKGRPRSKEVIDRIQRTKSQRVYVRSAAHRAKLSEANLGSKKGPCGAERKRKIGDANRGRKLSVEHANALQLGKALAIAAGKFPHSKPHTQDAKARIKAGRLAAVLAGKRPGWPKGKPRKPTL